MTTTWVLVEVGNALSTPAIRQQTHRLLEGLEGDPNTIVVPADAESYARGLTLYGSRGDKSWSLTDCISFEVMKDRGMSEARTGDHHFVQAGFTALFAA